MEGAVLTVDGVALKCPSKLDYEGQQLVDSARNALGEVVAQKINRRMVKLNLEWNVIYPDELKVIKQSIEKMFVKVRFYDTLSGGFITRQMYWGDDKVSTYWTDENGKPKMLTALSASLIDMGAAEE